MHDEDDEPEGEEAAAPVGPPLWDPEVVVSALVSVFADDAVPKTAHTNAAETLMDAVARSSYQPPQPTSFGGWNTSIDQEAEQQQKVPKTPMMEVLLKSQAGALIKALPNRGSFHILTRILEFSIDAKERGDEQDTTAFVDEIQSNLGSVFPTLDSAPGLSVVMTTYGKRAPTFGIERLLALELVAALSAARPTVLSDDQMVVLFGFIARFPTHSILHSVVTNLILDRGAIPGGIRRAIVEWYDQAQESVPLEVAYGGHYLQIAVALNLEHERVAETKVRWEKELGEGNSLLHTQNAGAVSGGPELEYTFGDDSSSGEDDDDDDDDEIDADLLRARYGFAPAAELGAGLGDNSNSTDGADANPGGIEAGSEDKGVSDSNSEDAASNNEKTENFAAFETGAQDQAEVVWDAFNNGEAGNDAQENTFATFEAFGEDSTVKAGEDDAPRME